MAMSSMRSWVFSLAVALGALALTGSGCGDDAKQATPCTGDDSCAFGQICGASGFCEVVPCATDAECPAGNQACITVGASKSCAVVECGCRTCGQCPAGEECNNGECVLGGGGNTCPNGQADCGASEVCDAGSCRPCQGAECPQAGCETAGCPTGQTCNTVSHQCEGSTSTAAACDHCANIEACGGAPWKCVPLGGGGSSCLPPCGSNTDCETGWLCQGGNCVPSNFRCDGCMKDGCPSGEACNPNSNACEAATAQCASCATDWECGAGMACADNTCVPRCVDGACAGGGSCVTSGNQVRVCDGACASACTPACSGSTPICDGGTCVQCKDNDDCAVGQTCAGGACQGQQNCTAPTPIFWNGQCVQCTSNDHCGSGLFCSPTTNTCGSDVCSSCAAPYPACAQIGDDFYCVQCATDTDCGVGGTCNQQTYACEGGTVTPTAHCASDADCVDPTGTFDLACKNPGADGYCYDRNGLCDDVTARCTPTSLDGSGPQAECKSILDSFFGGAGGLPSLPGAGSAIPGVCSCSSALIFCRSGDVSGICFDLAGTGKGFCGSIGQ